MARNFGAGGPRQRQEAERGHEPDGADRQEGEAEVDQVGRRPGPGDLRQVEQRRGDPATPNSIATCCSMLDSVAAELRCAEAISAKASVLSAVNCIDRVSPAISISATTSACGVCGDTAAQAMIDSDAITPLTTSTERKPKRFSVGVVTVFMPRLPRK